MRGEYQIAYFTPEILLKRKEWRRMLLKEVYVHNLKTVVVDEAHTIKKW